MHFVSLGLAILIGVAGQIFLKIGANHMTSISDSAGRVAKIVDRNFLDKFLPYFLNFNLWLGLFFYGLSTLFYIYALQKIPLSLAYPTVSLGYIIVILLSNLIFKEPVSTQQIVGILLITSGVFFLWKK